MSIDTLNYLYEKHPNINKDDIVVISEASKGEDLDITPIQLSHDAPSYGYMIGEHSTGETLVFIADTGSLWNKDTIEMIKDKEYYCIESNHSILEQYFDTTRDSMLKRRCLSNTGHMSNLQAIELACKVVGDKTKAVQFTHLSTHTNSEQLALKTHLAYLEVWSKYTDWKHIKISYANQENIIRLTDGLTHKEIRNVR
jgi:ribonuclease BN (tRNA processing enzyme)